MELKKEGRRENLSGVRGDGKSIFTDLPLLKFDLYIKTLACAAKL